MKDRRDCKIVQDLLPNYIEKLTNEETNKYIEEHLIECNQCKKMLENMQKDLEINTEKIDKREVKYIKKYNSKLKILRNILLIIVVLFIVIVGRKTIILTSLSNKANEIRNENNFYLKTESYSEGQMTILEAYCKEEKILGKMISFSYPNENNVIEQILYKSGEEKISLIDNESTKVLVNMGDITINPVYFTGENFLENLFMAITTNIDKVKLNGKECYLVREENTEKFIDVNTGLAIKMIDNENNRTVDYKYEFGKVKDTDIVKPDTTGYTINE